MSGSSKTSLDRQEQIARIRQLRADAIQKEKANSFAAAQLFIGFIGAGAAITASLATFYHWVMTK
jgi:hypothetical protein